jgi:hypothetical protein
MLSGPGATMTASEATTNRVMLESKIVSALNLRVLCDHMCGPFLPHAPNNASF